MSSQIHNLAVSTRHKDYENNVAVKPSSNILIYCNLDSVIYCLQGVVTNILYFKNIIPSDREPNPFRT